MIDWLAGLYANAMTIIFRGQIAVNTYLITRFERASIIGIKTANINGGTLLLPRIQNGKIINLTTLKACLAPLKGTGKW